MATLTRMDKSAPDFSLRGLDETVAREAAERFGYRHAQRTLHAARTRSTLIEKLIALDAAPFAPESVARYKRAAHRKKWGQLFAALAGCIAMFGVCWWIGASARALHSGILFAVAVSGGLLSLIAIIVACVNIAPADWEWRRIPIRDYDKPIPAHVLQTALRLSTNLGVRHYIEEFRYSPVITGDPFLVVELDGEAAYVEVWNEPTFESEVPME